MTPLFRSFVRLTTTFLLVAVFSGLPQQLLAQEHVVSSDAIQRELLKSAAQRSQNEQSLKAFFGSEQATRSLKKAGINPEQVTNAISQLSDDELAQISAKAQSAQNDFAAGALTNQEITYLLIALGTAVIILVIVVA
ncbi:MAG TPA: hypothetical protein VN577_23805 [Terriglobales bacterium]|nr:hypothetical protein [Terriglobales bacterium]